MRILPEMFMFLTVSAIIIGEMEMWRCPDYLFTVAESRGGIIESGGHEKKSNLPDILEFFPLVQFN